MVFIKPCLEVEVNSLLTSRNLPLHCSFSTLVLGTQKTIALILSSRSKGGRGLLCLWWVLPFCPRNEIHFSHLWLIPVEVMRYILTIFGWFPVAVTGKTSKAQEIMLYVATLYRCVPVCVFLFPPTGVCRTGPACARVWNPTSAPKKPTVDKSWALKTHALLTFWAAAQRKCFSSAINFQCPLIESICAFCWRHGIRF